MITNDTCGSTQYTAGLFWLAPHIHGHGDKHPNQDEVYYIINGSGTLHLEGDPIALEAGDVVFVPKDHYHSVENSGDDVLKLFWAIGEGWAKKMILGGEQVDAKKAFTIGLVEEVVETGISLNRALELADQANKQSPISVTACKKLIHDARTSKESYGYEKEPFVDLFDSKDQAEGVAAFLEKRPPEWKNA